MAFNVEKRFPRKKAVERPAKEKKVFEEPKPLTPNQKHELDAISNIQDPTSISLGWSTPEQEAVSIKHMQRAQHERGRELRFAEEAYMATRAREKTEEPVRAARLEAEEKQRNEARTEVLRRLHEKQVKEQQLPIMRQALETEIASLREKVSRMSAYESPEPLIKKANALEEELKKLDAVDLKSGFLNPRKRKPQPASSEGTSLEDVSVSPMTDIIDTIPEEVSSGIEKLERSEVSPSVARAARMRELNTRWSASETTDAEKKQIREELKQLMEEEFPSTKPHHSEVLPEPSPEFEYDEAPAYTQAGQFLDDSEESPKLTPPTGLSAHEQTTLAEKFSPAEAVRIYQGGEIAPVSEQEKDVLELTEKVPKPETDLLDKEGVMVMSNSILTRQAMGVRSSKDKKLDPFKPFPAVPASSVQAPKQKQQPAASKKGLGKKKWFIGGGLTGVAALAAAFLGFNTRKEEASVGPQHQARPPIVEPGITQATPLSSADAPPPQVIPFSAPAGPATDIEQSTPVERISTYPTVRKHPRLTKEEFKKWDVQFNTWMKKRYPDGYLQEDTDKVRKQMVDELGYPRGKQAEKIITPETQPVMPTAPSEAPRKRTVEDSYTTG